MGKSGGRLKRAIGLMSGTSMDAIDVVMIETDGEDEVVRGPCLTLPYNPGDRRLLAHAMQAAQLCTQRDERPHALQIAEELVTRMHGAAVAALMAQYGLDRSTIDVIGFHGQTVLHKAVAQTVTGTDYKLGVAEFVTLTIPKMLTIQLGDGAALAKMTNIDVVFDMRAADTAAGGQGAPLVPIYHKALVSKLPQRPLAVVNIGGVSNVTYVCRDAELLAFDTGPGNALMDDWMLRHAGEAYDKDGTSAARGRVDENILHAWLGHDHFARVPPKSLDRNSFSAGQLEGLSVEDGAATLAAFTALSIAKAREHFPEQPELWVVAGGGRKNKTIMSMLAGRVENAVVPAEAVGLDGDMIEAEAWAYLAVRSLRGLPITFPGTTGVDSPMTGGVYVKAM